MAGAYVRTRYCPINHVNHKRGLVTGHPFTFAIPVVRRNCDNCRTDEVNDPTHSGSGPDDGPFVKLKIGSRGRVFPPSFSSSSFLGILCI